MKVLLLVTLVAAAYGEADPYLLYGHGGYGYAGYGGHGYLGYAGWPYAYGAPLAYASALGCKNNAGAAVPCALPSPYFWPGIVHAAPAAPAAEAGVEEARKKREAEADPYLFYGHGGYAGYGHAGYGYAGYSGHLGYAGYGGWPYAYGAYLGHHGVGCRNNAGALVPCA